MKSNVFTTGVNSQWTACGTWCGTCRSLAVPYISLAIRYTELKSLIIICSVEHRTNHVDNVSRFKPGHFSFGAWFTACRIDARLRDAHALLRQDVHGQGREGHWRSPVLHPPLCAHGAHERAPLLRFPVQFVSATSSQC